MDQQSPSEKAATIYDVAAAAGVSPSTVSRAFSRPGRVSAKTSAHIHQVAAELGYRAPRVVRAETSRQSKMLAIALTDITNPFFFSIIRGAEHVAVAEGYSILLVDSEESDELERRLFDRTLPMVDGMIVAASRLSDMALRTAAKSTPMVSLNRLVPGIPSVITDNARGMRRALEHLAELGHRRVAYIAGPYSSWQNRERLAGLADAHELGIEVVSVASQGTIEAGYQSTELALESDPTAILTFNDLAAIGVLTRLGELGLDVPGDVSVAGFDDIELARYVRPRLTTVVSPKIQLGATAWQQMTASLRGESDARAQHITSPVVVRESTGPVEGS